MNRYLRPGLLFLACMLLFALPEPDFLRRFILNGLLAAVLILIPLHLIFTDKTYTDPHSALTYWMIGIAGALLTCTFWFRITSGSYGIETGFLIKLSKTFFFWAPAALFAILYRADGEGWISGKRGTVLTRLLVAVAGSLAGLAAAEFAQTQIDRTPLESALIHVERQLPDGNHRIESKRDRSVFHLDVILDSSYTEPNIHSLQRLRSIANQSARLTGRRDTDSLTLRILRNDTKLAALSWPDSASERPVDRLRINYSGTGLSNLPAPGDLGFLFDTVQQAFRPKNLEATLDDATLVLRWTDNPENSLVIPLDPFEMPAIFHDWQAANHIAIHAAGLFEGLESIRLDMPGHSVSAAADSINVHFRFQQLLPVPGASVTIQMFDNEEMPDLPQAAGSAPVMIVWGDGEFDTRRYRNGPLWPWDKGALAGYQFYITGLEADGTVHFVIHPIAHSDEASQLTLQPGQTQQLDSLYLRNLVHPPFD